VTNNIGSEQVGTIGMIASIFPRNDVCFSLQCPVCSQRFADTVSLVAHFEQSHGETTTQQRPPATQNDTSQCSLS
jgi:uncharacterized C2H2 Zn-finger protein